MLRTRVITAIVLLAILLPALFYPDPVPFCALMLVLIAAGGWEWGRLNGLGPVGSVLTGAVSLGLCAGAWALGGLTRPLGPLWLAAGVVWVLGGAALLRAGVAGWPRAPRAVRLVGGVAVLCVAWLAMAQARVLGVNFLLSALVLVWVADIGAYFAGRTFGRRKLALTISPGKSWEGVWGGMLGVALLAAGWIALDRHLAPAVPSLYTQLAGRAGWVLPLAVVFLAAMSVVGDLAESLVKRAAGFKDSSNLLPGHGGVLDRVDALLPTLPLVMLMVTL